MCHFRATPLLLEELPELIQLVNRLFQQFSSGVQFRGRLAHKLNSVQQFFSLCPSLLSIELQDIFTYVTSPCSLYLLDTVKASKTDSVSLSQKM